MRGSVMNSGSFSRLCSTPAAAVTRWRASSSLRRTDIRARSSARPSFMRGVPPVNHAPDFASLHPGYFAPFEAAVDFLLEAAVVESQPMDGRSGVAEADSRYGNAKSGGRRDHG